MSVLLGVVSLVAWSAAVLLVMWAAASDAPIVALDAFWLLASSAFLSAASLVFATRLDRPTGDEAGPAQQQATLVDAHRVLD